MKELGKFLTREKKEKIVAKLRKGKHVRLELGDVEKLQAEAAHDIIKGQRYGVSLQSFRLKQNGAELNMQVSVGKWLSRWNMQARIVNGTERGVLETKDLTVTGSMGADLVRSRSSGMVDKTMRYWEGQIGVKRGQRLAAEVVKDDGAELWVEPKVIGVRKKGNR